MEIDWQFIISEEFRLGILAGLKTTVVISIYAIAGAILIGVIIGLMQVSGYRMLRQLGQAYITFFRNIEFQKFFHKIDDGFSLLEIYEKKNRGSPAT